MTTYGNNISPFNVKAANILRETIWLLFSCASIYAKLVSFLVDKQVKEQEFKHFLFKIVRKTRVQSQVETYQRLKKWYLMPPCFTLCFIR